MATAKTPRPSPATPDSPAPPRLHAPEPPRSMRACVIRGIGELDQVEIADLPEPRSGMSLGAREVRVAVHAAALNHLDLFVVRGLPLDYTFPHVLGSDGAGVVDGVGPEVTAVRPGEPVLINPGVSCYACEFCQAGEHALCVSYRVLGEHLPGTMAEYIVVPEANVARIPRVDPPLTWPEAAAFSLATLTAWRMVVTRARVRAGEWVLVWGIGGGVALAAMRIAKLRGARVIVTSSSDAKLAEAKKLGADVTLNHRTQQVAQEVRALTGKRGVDVVVENVGDATWEESLRALARSGRLVTCGATTGPKVVTDVRRLFWNQYTIMGSTMGNWAEYREIVRVLSEGRLRPPVDRVYPLAEARAALERLEQGEQLGKVVVRVAD
jgi:NADPH:quinone reductase-like Zn-dependent oxidoreductase